MFDIQGEADDDLMCKPKEGISRLQLRFAEIISNGLTAIVYGVFPSILYCDVSRNLWW